VHSLSIFRPMPLKDDRGTLERVAGCLLFRWALLRMADRRSGPERYFAPESLEEFQPLEGCARRAPTWRGWAVGFLSVVSICLCVPHAEYVIRHTMLSDSLFPFSALFVLAAMVLLVTVLTSAARASLALTRQDMVLVYCMALVVSAIPGAGLCAMWVATISGSQFFSRPENRWNETITPRYPESWIPRDPVSPDAPGPRPVEWFYSGLPPGESIPWGAWVTPFLTWLIPLCCLFALMFGLCLLLRRQWSERERLPFPLAQLPQEMTTGWDGGKAKPFFRDRAVLFGILLVFLLHGWNGLTDYVVLLPRIPLDPMLDPYLSEPPWRGLTPFWCFLFPSVVGLTFLLSLEVSFSLWFFYLVMKCGQLAAIRAGWGQTGWDFYGQEGTSGIFSQQGMGALIAMVLLGAWMARRSLGKSLRAALGFPSPPAELEEIPPRVPWVLVACGIVGMVGWLACFGVPVWYSLPAVLLAIVMMTGFTRICCETGIFYTQISVFPAHLCSMVLTPAAMGAHHWFLLRVWDRMMVGDQFRVLAMPNIMNALHLASVTGLKRRSVVAGAALALIVAVPLGFASLLHTGYHIAGGARTTGWAFGWYMQGECSRMSATLTELESYENRRSEAAAGGSALAAEEQPRVAKPDTSALGWMALGGIVFAVMAFLRNYLFWWPHPIGYVAWMGQWPLINQWFSFFLGWCIKFAAQRYGGMRFYLRARRFFMGVIVGEAVVAVLWLIVAWLAGHSEGYHIGI